MLRKIIFTSHSRSFALRRRHKRRNAQLPQGGVWKNKIKPNKTRKNSEVEKTLKASGIFKKRYRLFNRTNFVCDATRMCMNDSRIIMNAAQRIIHAHSCFIHAHSCYAVGKYIYVCDATRMCMNGSRIIMNAAQRIIHAHSCFIHAHSCYAVGNFVCDATRMCMNESRIIMNAAPNVIHGSFTGHSCYRRDARMKREWAVNFIFALLPQGGLEKTK